MDSAAGRHFPDSLFARLSSGQDVECGGRGGAVRLLRPVLLLEFLQPSLPVRAQPGFSGGGQDSALHAAPDRREAVGEFHRLQLPRCRFLLPDWIRSSVVGGDVVKQKEKHGIISRLFRASAGLWIAGLLVATTARARTLVVSPAGPLTTVQQAIATASPGDLVRIERGTYQGNIVVDKALHLKASEGRSFAATVAAASSR